MVLVKIVGFLNDSIIVIGLYCSVRLSSCGWWVKD